MNRNIVLIFLHYVFESAWQPTVEISATVCNKKAKNTYVLTPTYFQNVPVVLECTNFWQPFIKASIQVVQNFTLLIPFYPSVCAIRLQLEEFWQLQVILKRHLTERKMKWSTHQCRACLDLSTKRLHTHWRMTQFAILLPFYSFKEFQLWQYSKFICFNFALTFPRF